MKQNRESDISFFQRYLTVWVFLCMVAGVPLGVSNVSVPFDTLILSMVLFLTLLKKHDKCLQRVYND